MTVSLRLRSSLENSALREMTDAVVDELRHDRAAVNAGGTYISVTVDVPTWGPRGDGLGALDAAVRQVTGVVERYAPVERITEVKAVPSVLVDTSKSWPR